VVNRTVPELDKKLVKIKTLDEYQKDHLDAKLRGLYVMPRRSLL
jgi:hypothetical protein